MNDLENLYLPNIDFHCTFRNLTLDYLLYSSIAMYHLQDENKLRLQALCNTILTDLNSVFGQDIQGLRRLRDQDKSLERGRVTH